MIIRFDTTNKCDGQQEGRTDGTGCAYAQYCAAKITVHIIDEKHKNELPKHSAKI